MRGEGGRGEEEEEGEGKREEGRREKRRGRWEHVLLTSVMMYSTGSLILSALSTNVISILAL